MPSRSGQSGSTGVGYYLLCTGCLPHAVLDGCHQAGAQQLISHPCGADLQGLTRAGNGAWALGTAGRRPVVYEPASDQHDAAGGWLHLSEHALPVLGTPGATPVLHGQAVCDTRWCDH